MESERLLVSICIANYNGRPLLVDCIASIEAQARNFDVEIIVHDDASSDDSATWLREHHPRIRTIVSERNVGFCIGNNRMARIARGEYLLLLNNDAALFPDALSSLIETALHSAPDAILTLPQYDWYGGQLVDRGCLLDPFCNPVPNVDAQRSDVAMCIGACLWIPRRRWFELGGFPEWMESVGEDLYLCCLHRLMGGQVRCLPSSGYRHRQGASFGGNRGSTKGLQTTTRRRILSERNKTAVLYLCTPGALMPPLLACHLAALAIEGCILALLKRDAQIWTRIYGPAICSPIRHAKEWRSLRRMIQRRRTVSIHAYFRPFTICLRKLQLLRQYGVPRIQS